MFTIKELYVLNRALDGEDIFSIPSFSELGLSEVLISQIKEKLMVKGILNDYSSFTQEGIRSLKMIQRLKQAPIKIRINSLLIGSVTDDLAVVCVHDLFTDTYDFHYADQLNTLASVSEKYDFSLTEKKPVEQKEVTKKMSKYEFEQKQRKLTGLLIDKKTENQSTKQFFFKEEGILYIYNYKSRELKSKKEPDFMDEIERSLTLDDN